jgi:hypothetical protein
MDQARKYKEFVSAAARSIMEMAVLVDFGSVLHLFSPDL